MTVDIPARLDNVVIETKIIDDRIKSLRQDRQIVARRLTGDVRTYLAHLDAEETGMTIEISDDYEYEFNGLTDTHAYFAQMSRWNSDEVEVPIAYFENPAKWLIDRAHALQVEEADRRLAEAERIEAEELEEYHRLRLKFESAPEPAPLDPNDGYPTQPSLGTNGHTANWIDVPG